MFVVKKRVQLIIEIVDFNTFICHKSTTMHVMCSKIACI